MNRGGACETLPCGVKVPCEHIGVTHPFIIEKPIRHLCMGPILTCPGMLSALALPSCLSVMFQHVVCRKRVCMSVGV
jgi:hypothetical protein